MTSSYLTDRFGRKYVHIVAQLGVVVFGIGTSFAQTYIGFVVLKTITGIFVVVRNSIFLFYSDAGARLMW